MNIVVQGSTRRTSRSRMSLRSVAVGFALGLAVAGAAACGTGTKEEVAKTALDAMPKNERLDSFEATSRVLDEHPEFVDEFYSAARRHPALFDRFIMNAARDLKDEQYATITAKHLVANPDSLEKVLVTTMDFIAKAAAPRAAMNRAMISRAEEATDIITDDPATVARLVEAGLLIVEKKPQARRSAVLAVQKNRGRILAFVKEDPALSKELGEQVVREMVKDKPALEQALRAAKVIDDNPVPPPPR